MTCRGFVESLGVLEDLSAEQRASFEAHRAECADCARYAKSYTDTIALAKRALGDRDEPGEQIPEDLVQAILAARAKGRIS